MYLDDKQLDSGALGRRILADPQVASSLAGKGGTSLAGIGPTDVSSNKAWNSLPGSMATGNVGTTTFAANNIYYYPMMVTNESGITLTDLTLEVTTAASSGGTIQFVVGTANSAWEPTGLYTGGDLGTVASDAIAVVTKSSIGLSLTRGRYLLGVWFSNHGNVTCRRIGQVPQGGSWMATGGWGTSPFIIVAARGTNGPTTVPNYNGLTAGSTAGLLCPVMAKWSIN